MQSHVSILIGAAAVMFTVIGGLSLMAHYYTPNGIKKRTVGEGEHGIVRFATKQEIKSPISIFHFSRSCGERAKTAPQSRPSFSVAAEEKTASRHWWTPTTSTV